MRRAPASGGDREDGMASMRASCVWQGEAGRRRRVPATGFAMRAGGACKSCCQGRGGGVGSSMKETARAQGTKRRARRRRRGCAVQAVSIRRARRPSAAPLSYLLTTPAAAKASTRLPAILRDDPRRGSQRLRQGSATARSHSPPPPVAATCPRTPPTVRPTPQLLPPFVACCCGPPSAAIPPPCRLWLPVRRRQLLASASTRRCQTPFAAQCLPQPTRRQPRCRGQQLQATHTPASASRSSTGHPQTCRPTRSLRPLSSPSQRGARAPRSPSLPLPGRLV